MNNLILYKGGSTFLLLQNVPERPTKSFEAAHYVSAEHEYLQALYEYEEAMKACEESAKEIINEELLPLYFGEGGDVYLQSEKGETLLKPGDTFPLPANILFEEYTIGGLHVHAPHGSTVIGGHDVIRLYASKEEEKKVRPLKEHFEIETDAGTTLRTFDYIAALEEYIDSIDLNKNI